MSTADLSAEEKVKPYANYFNLQPAAPDLESLRLVQPGQPIDPNKALPIENLNDLLNPGYM